VSLVPGRRAGKNGGVPQRPRCFSGRRTSSASATCRTGRASWLWFVQTGLGRNASSTRDALIRAAADIIPGWTPDGRHITFSRVVGPFVNGNAASAVLYTAELDGSHIRRLSEPGYRWCVRELSRQIRQRVAS
jgi:hypothetical protein